MTVVVSTGHSGTAWLAEALTACGVPADHEVRFHHTRPPRPVDTAVSVSWAAVPHIDSISADGVPIVQLVRDPLAVVRSIVSGRGDGFLRSRLRPSTAFVRQHRPDLLAVENLLDRVVAFVATWCPPMPVVVRVEDGPLAVQAVAASAGHRVDDETADRVCADLGTTVNTHIEDRVDIDWSDIDRTSHGRLLRALADFHGYAA